MSRLEIVGSIWHRQTWLGFPVTSMVAHKFGVSERHARRLVHEARQAGLIPLVSDDDGRKSAAV